MLLPTWSLVTALAMLESPTVQWDLSVELKAPADAAPDHVCLVTPVSPETVESPWFKGVPLEDLVSRGVLVRNEPEGPITFDRQSALRSSWFEGELSSRREPVRDAFEALRRAHSKEDDERCDTRRPTGCAASLELNPPQLIPDWPWAIMCSTAAEPKADATVAFVIVRAVDLDRGFTPFVEDFDAFGGSLQIRFDSVRTRRELQSATFRASVGVAGGDYHPVPATPSFAGRVRLPLRPRCRSQSFRLHEDPEREATRQRTAALIDGTEEGTHACAPDHFSKTEDTCVIERLRRGVFDMHVPMSPTPRRHQLDVRIEPEGDSTHTACVSSSWSDGKEDDVIELEPDRVHLRWRWPCFAGTSTELRCPTASVEGGAACEVDETLGVDGCAYRCDATHGNQQSVGWPVVVDLHHDELDMHWRYELQTVESEVVATFEPHARRFLVVRGPRDPRRSRNHEFEPHELDPWPAWWTSRRGDGIASASILFGDTETKVAPLGEPSPLVGAIGLAGAECRERVTVRYDSIPSSSRRYNAREVEVTWPYLELPAPEKTAFPVVAAANVGAGWGFVAGGSNLWQLQFALDVAYRGFATRASERKHSAWLLGLRYFVIAGQKEYIPLAPPGREEPLSEVIPAWRHGPALHFEFRFDQPAKMESLLGVGGTIGPGWTTPLARADAEGRFPIRRGIPFAYVAPELTFHYRFFRASVLLGVVGPDPTFELSANERGDPIRANDAPYRRRAWLIYPGFMIGAEI